MANSFQTQENISEIMNELSKQSFVRFQTDSESNPVQSVLDAQSQTNLHRYPDADYDQKCSNFDCAECFSDKSRTFRIALSTQDFTWPSDTSSPKNHFFTELSKIRKKNFSSRLDECSVKGPTSKRRAVPDKENQSLANISKPGMNTRCRKRSFVDFKCKSMPDLSESFRTKIEYKQSDFQNLLNFVLRFVIQFSNCEHTELQSKELGLLGLLLKKGLDLSAINSFDSAEQAKLYRISTNQITNENKIKIVYGHFFRYALEQFRKEKDGFSKIKLQLLDQKITDNHFLAFCCWLFDDLIKAQRTDLNLVLNIATVSRLKDIRNANHTWKNATGKIRIRVYSRPLRFMVAKDSRARQLFKAFLSKCRLSNFSMFGSKILIRWKKLNKHLMGIYQKSRGNISKLEILVQNEDKLLFPNKLSDLQACYEHCLEDFETMKSETEQTNLSGFVQLCLDK